MGQIALAAPPQATVTGTAPGAGAATIDVTYTYQNAVGAKAVRYNVVNGAVTDKFVFPIGANGKGGNTVQTQWGNAAVTVYVDILDANNKVIVLPRRLRANE
jgi:hypothetical protein